MPNSYYSSDDIIKECKRLIKDPVAFYKSDIVNYRSVTTDSFIPCTEVIAGFLTEKENLDKLNSIIEQDRTENRDSYNMNHEGSYPEGKSFDEVNHESEKIIAIDLFRQCREDGPFADTIGRIIDYQTPLKTKQEDSYGEIDLLSVDDEKRKIYILELKKDKSHIKESPETLLRCILEAYTYYKLVSKTKLLDSFGLSQYGTESIAISPLVFKSDEQYEEWNKIKRGERKNLKRLIDALKVEVSPFFLELVDEKRRKYRITKE